MPTATQEKIARGALLLDIRRSTELEKTGRAEGSHHIPRGMLEFRADPASPCHDPQMRPDRAVVLHCAGGGRAALAGKLLTDMGHAVVCNPGGFKDWKEGAARCRSRSIRACYRAGCDPAALPQRPRGSGRGG